LGSGANRLRGAYRVLRVEYRPDRVLLGGICKPRNRIGPSILYGLDPLGNGLGHLVGRALLVARSQDFPPKLQEFPIVADELGRALRFRTSLPRASGVNALSAKRPRT
jgi:hypothetical protein